MLCSTKLTSGLTFVVGCHDPRPRPYCTFTNAPVPKGSPLHIANESKVTSNVLQTLAQELNGTAIETFWTGTAYLLSNAVFVPFIGVTSEITGRRAAVLFALIAFTVGTIICCTANGMTQLLAGRTVQGVGGSGIFVMSSIVITDIVPLRQRPKYQGLISAAWGLGAVFGPLLGGEIIQHTTWRVGLPLKQAVVLELCMTSYLLTYRRESVAFLRQLPVLCHWICYAPILQA